MRETPRCAMEKHTQTYVVACHMSLKGVWRNSLCFLSHQSVEKNSTIEALIVLEDHHSSLHQVLGIIRLN